LGGEEKMKFHFPFLLYYNKRANPKKKNTINENNSTYHQFLFSFHKTHATDVFLFYPPFVAPV